MLQAIIGTTPVPATNNAHSARPVPETKPFRVSTAYIDWAHGSAAEEEQPLAVKLCALADAHQGGKAKPYIVVDDPQLVAEIADVAELYVGGSDSNLRAAAVLARARTWLKGRGLSIGAALTKQARASPLL